MIAGQKIKCCIEHRNFFIDMPIVNSIYFRSSELFSFDFVIVFIATAKNIVVKP